MKSLVFTSLILLLLCSCTKSTENPNPTYEMDVISVSVDDVRTKFTLGAKAFTGGGGFRIEGCKDVLTAPDINIAVFTGTSQLKPENFLDGRFCSMYVEFFPDKNHDIANSYKNNSKPFEVTVNEVTSTTIKGTFTGEVQVSGTSKKKLLSNGIFYLRF